MKSKEIKILILKFENIFAKKSDIPKIRGSFAKDYPEFEELHNHKPDGSSNYIFPIIQYRIINNNPAIIALEKASDIVKNIFLNTKNINISGKEHSFTEKNLKIKKYNFGMTENPSQYKFISPWMALNQKNYKKYKNSNGFEKQNLLKNILFGNLLTLSKGLGYTIPDKDKINVQGFFNPIKINFKNQKMLGFYGNFITNFQIPDYLGLGKQSARGFGIVRKI